MEKTALIIFKNFILPYQTILNYKILIIIGNFNFKSLLKKVQLRQKPLP
ncbi:MAG: hypothetical protein ACLT5F_05475 [Anaerotignaceae bacterium]|nr:hypothetical protein [Eubacterium sp.]